MAPTLRHVLHEEVEERLRAAILSSRGVLAAANFAGLWPTQAERVKTAVRGAGRVARDAVGEIANAARMNVFEATECR